ncbi:MAG: DUF2730 family protein [Reyranella sp.]|jgi:hypothetical protein|nr:DUF2730 family protein [Reyranella sp.]
MDLETAVKLAQLAFVVAQASILLVIVLMKGTFATKKDVQAANTRADGAHHRLDLLDERLKGFPGYDVTNELREAVSQMGGSLRELKVEVRSIDDKVDDHKVSLARVERHLLNQAG